MSTTLFWLNTPKGYKPISASTVLAVIKPEQKAHWVGHYSVALPATSIIAEYPGATGMLPGFGHFDVRG